MRGAWDAALCYVVASDIRYAWSVSSPLPYAGRFRWRYRRSRTVRCPEIRRVLTAALRFWYHFEATIAPYFTSPYVSGALNRGMLRPPRWE
jgi:hypothetical protein